MVASRMSIAINIKLFKKMSNSHTIYILDKFLEFPRTTMMKRNHDTNLHIAVLVSRGKIIAEATNRVGSRSKGCGYSNCTIHAEKNVVKVLGDYNKMRDADMYVMRPGRGENSLNFMNSKPCPDCELFLNKCMRKYGLKNVYYTSS
jgi:deoxycytidylate deaminase